MRAMIVDANTQQMLPAGNSNSMVLVGFGDSVASMVRALKTIDKAAQIEGAAHTVAVEVVRLEHADARSLSQIVRVVYGVNEETPAPYGEALAITADPRTNSLVVRGAADQVERVLALVAALDVEAPVKAGSGKSK
jgi:type II secretory pathway component GspD/PulD (secretin)